MGAQQEKPLSHWNVKGSSCEEQEGDQDFNLTTNSGTFISLRSKGLDRLNSDHSTSVPSFQSTLQYYRVLWGTAVLTWEQSAGCGSSRSCGRLSMKRTAHTSLEEWRHWSGTSLAPDWLCLWRSGYSERPQETCPETERQVDRGVHGQQVRQTVCWEFIQQPVLGQISFHTSEDLVSLFYYVLFILFPLIHSSHYWLYRLLPFIFCWFDYSVVHKLLYCLPMFPVLGPV